MPVFGRIMRAYYLIPVVVEGIETFGYVYGSVDPIELISALYLLEDEPL
jgi:hypothetical protein